MKELGNWSCDFLPQGASALLKMLLSHLGFVLVGFLGTEGHPKCHTMPGLALCSLAPCLREQLLWGSGTMNAMWYFLKHDGLAFLGASKCASVAQTLDDYWQIYFLGGFFNPLFWTFTIFYSSLMFVSCSSSPDTWMLDLFSLLELKVLNQQDTLTLIIKVNWA